MTDRKHANRGTPLRNEGQSCAKQIGSNNMWKEIKGYEGYYEVSEAGEVRSLDRVVYDTKGCHKGKAHPVKSRMMKQSISIGHGRKDGYYVVNLHKDGISYVIPVHLLVARTFIPNTLNLPTVNHIDGNKLNNDVSNLEWVSYSDNNIHALKNGLRNPRGTPIAQLTTDGKLVGVYNSSYEATRLTGLSFNNISHCLNGRANTAYGFVWKRLSESPTTIPFGSTQGDELPAEAQRP